MCLRNQLITMKNNTVIAAILLCAINLVLIETFKIKIIFQQVLIIHSFLLSLALLSDLIQKKLSKLKNPTSSHLLSVNFLRILACIVFLLPIILNHEESDKNYIYNFFVCYFIYLFYDIIFKSKNQNKINI